MSAVTTQTPSPTLNRAAIAQAINLQAQLRTASDHGGYKIGVVHETIKLPDGSEQSFIHIGNPHQEGFIDVVTIPTRCTKEEIEYLRESAIGFKETSFMLTELALGYKFREPVIFEGDTSIGKTFTVNLFHQLIYGPETKPEDLYCNGETDVSQLLGKYVPATAKPEEEKRLLEFLKSEAGQNLLQEYVAAGVIHGQSGAKDKLEVAARAIGINLADFDFQFGALPRAAMCNVSSQGLRTIDPHRHGSGTILHIEELGLAHPLVATSLLLMRGEDGQFAKNFQLHQDGGRNIVFGEDFFLVISTNPLEVNGYKSRQEIDPALVRACNFFRMGSLCDESLELAVKVKLTKATQPPGVKSKHVVPVRNQAQEKPSPINRIFADQISSGRFLEIAQSPEIQRELSDLILLFHKQYAQELKDGEANGRRQRVPATLDDISCVSRYIAEQQSLDLKTNRVDLSTTFLKAIKRRYLGRLSDEELKKKLAEFISNELDDKTVQTENQRKINGQQVSRREYLAHLVAGCEAGTGMTQDDDAVEREKRNVLISQIVDEVYKHTDNNSKLGDIKKIFADKFGLSGDANLIGDIITDIKKRLRTAFHQSIKEFVESINKG